MSTVTIEKARANLDALCDEVISRREAVVVKRRGRESVAVVPADELEGLLETAHLLRSPRNAQRLLASLRNVREGKVKELTIEELRRKVGLDEARH